MPSINWNLVWSKKFENFQQSHPNKLYGTQWGDPELRGIRCVLQCVFRPRLMPGPLYKVVDRYIIPHVNPNSEVLEIGSGGGRWTRYLIGAKKVTVVDLNPIFFPELQRLFPTANFEFYQPRGCDLSGVAGESIDFAFSFGTFVHIDPDGIAQYLGELRRVLRPGALAVIQYSDKSKYWARVKPNFSNMTAPQMEAMAPMRIVDHNTRLLNHSNIIVFEK